MYYYLEIRRNVKIKPFPSSNVEEVVRATLEKYLKEIENEYSHVRNAEMIKIIKEISKEYSLKEIVSHISRITKILEEIKNGKIRGKVKRDTYMIVKRIYLANELARRLSNLEYKISDEVTKKIKEIYDPNKEKLFLLLGETKENQVMVDKIIIIDENGSEDKVHAHKKEVLNAIANEKVYRKGKTVAIIVHTHPDNGIPSGQDKVTTINEILKASLLEVYLIGGIIYKDPSSKYKLSLYCNSAIREINL